MRIADRYDTRCFSSKAMNSWSYVTFLVRLLIPDIATSTSLSEFLPPAMTQL
jgi:hypothetical protein